MTDHPLTSNDGDADVAAMRALLEGAASASVDADVPLDDFMRAAWVAYTGARPGMRDAMELEAMRTRINELRARGQLAQA